MFDSILFLITADTIIQNLIEMCKQTNSMKIAMKISNLEIGGDQQKKIQVKGL